MSMFGIARSPQLTVFGSGRRDALPSVVREAGSRAFICSDERFSRDPMLVALAASLRAAGIVVDVYDGTIAELPMECVVEATARARSFQPDVLIGLGGGSCIDLAKLVGICLAHPEPLSDYYGEFRLPGPIMPVIAVPTTAGTGSEVTPVAVLGDPARAVKVGISSPYLIPRVAICDPELTLSCPPGLTASSGADAMTHAIEAFTALRRPVTGGTAMSQVFVGKNSLSDLYARSAISALAGHLAPAVEEGGNLLAREQVMYGALAAGMAFGAAGTAAAHAIQYPVGALTHTAHGIGVATLLPYVMEFNRSYCIDEYAEIARLFGHSEEGLERERLADLGIEAVDALFQRIGVPRSLAELGLSAEQRSVAAEQSMSAARLVNNNPRLLDLDGMQKIVAGAFAGDRARLRGV